MAICIWFCNTPLSATAYALNHLPSVSELESVQAALLTSACGYSCSFSLSSIDSVLSV